MKKILIVEDEAVARKRLSKTLEKMGFSVIKSPNGRHGYETLLANDDIDLVLTDIMMPEMDGRELVRKIRESEEFKDLPIVMLSGVVGVKEIFDILQEGVTWFLPKPMKREALQEILDRTILEV